MGRVGSRIPSQFAGGSLSVRKQLDLSREPAKGAADDIICLKPCCHLQARRSQRGVHATCSTGLLPQARDDLFR